jgi:hypothetical protein
MLHAMQTRKEEDICDLKGQLDASWQAWFAPFQISCEAAGTTVLSRPLPDQAALFRYKQGEAT